MIDKYIDLLEKIKEIELRKLKEFDYITHPPTIGSMFEGLTETLLNKAIFKGLGLNVVTGMIKNSKGVISKQIDCMIVIGKGERIPNTNIYVYPYKQVVAVIEVKKNLYSSDLVSSYHNLKSVVDLFEGKSINYNAVRDAFVNITKRELCTGLDLDNLSADEKNLYYLLIEEANLPVRIVFGYYGFVSEYSLRESFINYLGENLSSDVHDIKKGFGVVSFPNLIICNNSSLVKLNGMPYSLKIIYTEDRKSHNDFIEIYGSFSKNPLHVMLELLWTRLSYMFNLPIEIFGDDLIVQTPHPFIGCRIKELNGLIGYEYKYNKLEQKELDEYAETEEYMPLELNEEQFILINLLCQFGRVGIDDPDVQKLYGSEGRDEFIRKIKNTCIVNVDAEGNFYLITERCQSALLPDGRMIAGEDKTGVVSRWIENYFRSYKSE